MRGGLASYLEVRRRAPELFGCTPSCSGAALPGIEARELLGSSFGQLLLNPGLWLPTESPFLNLFCNLNFVSVLAVFEHTPRGVGWGFGLNIVTTSELAGGGGQQPKPHVRRFWFNPTLT